MIRDDFNLLKKEVDAALGRTFLTGEAPDFTPEVSSGDRVTNTFSPVSAGYILKPNYVYEFVIMFTETDFDFWTPLEIWQMDHLLKYFDDANPYAKVNWWGAADHELHIQIQNGAEQPIDRVWDMLLTCLGFVYLEEKTITRSFEVQEITEDEEGEEEEVEGGEGEEKEEPMTLISQVLKYGVYIALIGGSFWLVGKIISKAKR